MESEKQFQEFLKSKPLKPNLSDFDLTEEHIKELEKHEKSNYWLEKIIDFIIFAIILSVFIYFLHDNDFFYFALIGIFFYTVAVQMILDYLAKWISRKSISDLILDLRKSKNITTIFNRLKSYNLAILKYNEEINRYERVISRGIHRYWLALNPIEFENAVADLFMDKGWNVRKTPSTRDGGVDLFIEKDGLNAIVQCKTYKKVIGPNVVRELYGTMVAHNAKRAFLSAPGGFSDTARQFCKNKPITLLDIDELTKMFYDFDNYTPHVIESITSIDDAIKLLKKQLRKRF